MTGNQFDKRDLCVNPPCSVMAERTVLKTYFVPSCTMSCFVVATHVNPIKPRNKTRTPAISKINQNKAESASLFTSLNIDCCNCFRIFAMRKSPSVPSVYFDKYADGTFYDIKETILYIGYEFKE